MADSSLNVNAWSDSRDERPDLDYHDTHDDDVPDFLTIVAS